MDKKKNSAAANDLGATQAGAIFVAVAEKIERRRREAPVRMTIYDDNGLTTSEMDMTGASFTLRFDSTEDAQRFISEKYPPETGAWKRIAEIATLAKGDQWVRQSESAVAFLGMIEAIANRTMGGDSSSQILEPLSDFLKSEQARKNAQSKNGTARAWVLSEWRNRTDQTQKKAAFSRQYSSLVKNKFSLLVTPDTIARDWLPR